MRQKIASSSGGPERSTDPRNSVPLNTISPTRVRQTFASNKQSDTQISDQQQQEIQQLKARECAARAHEAAHLAAGDGIVRSDASFTFQRGPDGVQYAIGGEVQIDTSEVSGDPQATLEKHNRFKLPHWLRPNLHHRIVA